MGSMNKWIGIGNLGKDPEVRYTPAGDAVCNFNIACNEEWKDKAGAKQERVEWVSVVAWRKLAELCGEYLAKGRQVCVEGKLQTRKWDKDGVTHYKTEVVASSVVFLGGKSEGKPVAAAASKPATDEQPPMPSESEIPF